MAPSRHVTRLRSRAKPFEEIVDSYFDGLFAPCIGALAGHATTAAAALAARAQLRLGRPAEALVVVGAVIAAKADLTHAERGELEMLRAGALARLGQAGGDAMRASLTSARAHIFSALAPALEVELAFTEAYAHAVAGDLDAARLAARAVFDVAAIDDGENGPAHLVPLAHSRARALDLLAFLAARAEDDDSQRAHLRAALDTMRGARHDAAFEANVLVNLGIFARERGDADGFVRERLERLPPGDHLDAQRYEILRSLAWSNALAGNHLGTFRDLREAGEVAPTTATKIRATLDRAFFARELGQGLIAREELDYALRSSERVDWNDVASDEGELDALLQLAVGLLPVDAVRARSIFERYRRLRSKLPPERLAGADRRARAELLAAEAAFARAEGDRDRAERLLLDAFDTWQERGYTLRAAVVARELADLGAGQRFTAYVDREVRQRPQTWFAVSVARSARAGYEAAAQ